MLTKLRADKRALGRQLYEAQSEAARGAAAANVQRVERLTRQINDLSDLIRRYERPPQVSDHAVLRYLERHYQIDIDQIRKEILTPAVRQAMAMGACSVKIGRDKLIIQRNTIVTYWKPGDGE
jgi:transposase